MILSRRRALQALSVLPAAGFVGAMPRVARAAEFKLKYGNNLPLAHPINMRAPEAGEGIRARRPTAASTSRSSRTASSAATPTC